MTDKQKSKKSVARDYFASLDGSLSLRSRVDNLVEFMKIEYVNGQTERVVFNYIRDSIPDTDLPKVNSALMKKLLKHKIENKNFITSGSSNFENGPSSRWSAMKQNEKFCELLSLMDLYETDKVFSLEHGAYVNSSNTIDIKIDNSQIAFGIHRHKCTEGPEVWFSKFSKKYDLIRNHFPFFTKEQLENSISNDDLIDIVRDYLSNKELIEFVKLINIHGSARNSYTYLIKSKAYTSNNDRNKKSSGDIGSTILGWIFLIGVSLLLIKCVSGNPNEGKTELQIKTERVCEAAGGCYN